MESQQQISSKDLPQHLDTALGKLKSLWDEVGITGEAYVARDRAVALHVIGLLDQMILEEEAMKAEILCNIDKHNIEVQRLTNELGLPPYEANAKMSWIQQEKELKKKMEELQAEVSDRLQCLKDLSRADQHLCDALCATPYYIPTGSIPTLIQLAELEEHVQKLENEKVKRQIIFRNTKQTIVQLLSDLDLSPNSSFEREVFCEEEDSFLLSSENMKSLKHYHDQLETRQKENLLSAEKLRSQVESLWNRLSFPEEERQEFLARTTGFKPRTIQTLQEEVVRLKLLKIENLRNVIEATRRELESWWDRCYYGREQRDAFYFFHSEEYSEESLEKHDEELNRVKQFHEDNHDLFDKVHRREQLWNQFLEFERKANDPSRLFVRGYNLLEEDKTRQRLKKELPKVEHEVEKEIQLWERKTGQIFTIFGVSYSEYTKAAWEEHKQKKELEKMRKQQQRAKQAEEEALFGSKPITPSKKRPAPPTITPGKSTCAKIRKVMPLSCQQSQVPAIVSSVVKTTTLTTATAGNENRVQLAGEALSHTTVSSSEIVKSEPDKTLAPVENYNMFAMVLNENIRSNCRSSVVPKPLL